MPRSLKSDYFIKSKTQDEIKTIFKDINTTGNSTQGRESQYTLEVSLTTNQTKRIYTNIRNCVAVQKYLVKDNYHKIFTLTLTCIYYAELALN